MKKAIVVGASSGIGKTLAILLSKNNYKVGVTGRRKNHLLEIQNSNPKAFVIRSFDLTADDNASKLSELTKELGGLDLLVLSSGTGKFNKNLEYPIEQETLDLNVNAFTEVLNFAYHFFEKQGQGHLVAISSIAGIRGGAVAPAYNASKAYQMNYLEGLRQKTKKLKLPIYITDVRPGFVDTDMAKGDGKFWVASKEKAARQIFQAIRHKKDIIYVSKRWYLIALLLKVLPNWMYKRM